MSSEKSVKKQRKQIDGSATSATRKLAKIAAAAAVGLACFIGTSEKPFNIISPMPLAFTNLGD